MVPSPAKSVSEHVCGFKIMFHFIKVMTQISPVYSRCQLHSWLEFYR